MPAAAQRAELSFQLSKNFSSDQDIRVGDAALGVPSDDANFVCCGVCRVRFSTSLKKNHEFRRLYNKGKTAATQNMAVYCRRTGRDINRLGVTVSTKLGGAVQRNRIRRRFKEIYRINEQLLRPGYDIVVVARMKSRFAEFKTLEADMLRLLKKLGVIGAEK